MIENQEIILPNGLKIIEFEFKSWLGKHKTLNDFNNVMFLPKNLNIWIQNKLISKIIKVFFFLEESNKG